MIARPNGPVERKGQSYPDEIWDKQQAGNLVVLPERDHRGAYGDPQKTDDDAARCHVAQPKENTGPQCVERELYRPKRQSLAGVGKISHPRCCHGYAHVKKRPDNWKQPVRRCPGRLAQASIPFTWPKQGARNRGRYAGGEKGEEQNPIHILPDLPIFMQMANKATWQFEGLPLFAKHGRLRSYDL